MKYNINTNNRDIVSQICISEFEQLMTKADFVQDRQMLQAMIDRCKQLLWSGIPMQIDRFDTTIGDCKCYNSCSTCY